MQSRCAASGCEGRVPQVTLVHMSLAALNSSSQGTQQLLQAMDSTHGDQIDGTQGTCVLVSKTYLIGCFRPACGGPRCAREVPEMCSSHVMPVAGMPRREGQRMVTMCNLSATCLLMIESMHGRHVG